MMTVKEVAARYYELVKQRMFQEAQDELYADNVVSVEQEAMAGMPLKVEWKESLAKKAEAWNNSMEEMLDGRCSEPIVAWNCFACSMWFKARMKDSDEISEEEEVCVFHVKDGKIVKEQFFW